MPWTKKNYPDSMKNLPKEVRDKSIEIANALIADTSMPEGIAIATAISRAKDWAANRGMDTDTSSASSRKTDQKKHGEDQYVTPREDGKWALKKEGAKRPKKLFDSKADAVGQARKAAKKSNASVTIQSKEGKIQKRVSFNPGNKGKKTR